MEKKSKVVSKRLQKQLEKLTRNGRFEEAVKLLEPIAQEGNPNAQHQLGKLLFDIMRDKEDYTGIEKVVYWYEEAAKQGYAQAMAALGELYFPGNWDTWMRTIKQSPTFSLYADLQKSLSYFVQASENGEWIGAINSTSIYNLLHSRTATDDEKNDADFDAFYANLPSVQYIMEEFVNGEVCSYDALVNSKGEVLFETGNITLISIVDAVNEKEDVYFYIVDHVADDLADAGRRTLQAFGVRNRLVHFEFFRLLEDREGLGKKGDIIGLEVNMRPCGGFTPDMYNYANSFDIYKLWADMICYDQIWLSGDREISNCLFVGRRKGKTYRHSHEEIMSVYGDRIWDYQELPQVLADGMGDYMYLTKCKTYDELMDCIHFMVE